MYFLSASNGASGGSMISLWRWEQVLFGKTPFVRRAPFSLPVCAAAGGASAGRLSNGRQRPAATGELSIETTTPANSSPLTGPTTRVGNDAIGSHARLGHPVACVQCTSSKFNGRPRYCSTGSSRRESWTLPHFPSLAVDQAGNVALAYTLSARTSWHPLTPISAGAQGSENGA